VFVALLDNHTGKDISTTLAAVVYFVLSVTCGPYMALQRNFGAKLKANWWKFLIVGVTDVQGSYLQNLSLKDTTVTSSMVIVLFLYLHCTYLPKHTHTHTRTHTHKEEKSITYTLVPSEKHCTVYIILGYYN